MASTPEHSANPDPTSAGKTVSNGRRLIGIFGLGILLVFVLYAIQQLMLPEVDESKTTPVVISHGDGNEQEDRPDVNQAAGLPENCLTANITQAIIDQADHPLDPLKAVAEEILESIDSTIEDYTATISSQVMIGGDLQPEQYLFCKIRHQRELEEDGQKIPFAAYTRFLKPQNLAGQEAIWVQGKHNGKLIAHGTGLLNVKRLYLDPEGPLAMNGNRYPIQDIGFRNLIAKIFEQNNGDLHFENCEVTLTRNVDVNGRTCSLLEVFHSEPLPEDEKLYPGFNHCLAKIYLDDERNIPIAYEGYLCTTNREEEPKLLEKYYYSDIQINVGLTDADFDPSNKEYNYPVW